MVRSVLLNVMAPIRHARSRQCITRASCSCPEGRFRPLPERRVSGRLCTPQAPGMCRCSDDILPMRPGERKGPRTMGRLTDRVALVTGAGVRVGRCIASTLADAGAHVVVHFRESEAEARDLVEEIQRCGGSAQSVQAELTDHLQVDEMFTQIQASPGRLDILVNSAAIFEKSPIRQMKPEDFDRMIDSNLRAPFLCMRRALELMTGPGASIVNILCVGASQAWPGFAHYCAAKAGLEMMTRVLALELAPDIRVNGVAPGTVLWSDRASDEEKSRVIRNIPLGRIGTPQDIADAVLFLVSGPDFVTGQVITVDGGRSIHTGGV